MSKKSKSNFYDVAMFSFSRPILLMSVRAGDMMDNAKRPKKLPVKFLIFPSSVRLNTLNSHVKKALNMRLKLQKDVLCLISIVHEIDQRKFAKVINEADIVLVTTNKNRSRAPNITENELERFGGVMYRMSIR
jgi:hypothetical protein